MVQPRAMDATAAATAAPNVCLNRSKLVEHEGDPVARAQESAAFCGGRHPRGGTEEDQEWTEDGQGSKAAEAGLLSRSILCRMVGGANRHRRIVCAGGEVEGEEGTLGDKCVENMCARWRHKQ